MQEHSTRRRRRWLTAYAPLIIWVVVVLGLGTDIGSSEETSRFIGPLLRFLFPDAHPDTVAMVHAVVRKCAHVTEYALLAFFAWNAFRHFRYRYPIAFILVAAVACLDEYGQSFDPNRTSSPYDVLLDILGGLLLLALIRLFTRRRP